MRSYISVVCLMMAGLLFADTTPVMVSLFTPVQAPASDYDVKGVRLSLIYGECQEFTGLDIGIVDSTRKDFTGVAIGGANIAADRLRGAQLGLINWNNNGAMDWSRRSTGAQLGLVNYADTFIGLQDGFVNIANGTFMGLQASLFNCAHDVYGLQCGFYFLLGVNVASGSLHGCQIGLVNYANRVDDGLQIGFVNIIEQNGYAPVFPIVNGNF